VRPLDPGLEHRGPSCARRAAPHLSLHSRLARSYGLVIILGVLTFALVLGVGFLTLRALTGRPLTWLGPRVWSVQALTVEDSPIALPADGRAPAIAVFGSRVYTPEELDRLLGAELGRRLATAAAGALAVTVLGAAGAGLLLARRVTRPLGAMADLAREISETGLGRRLVVPDTDDELARLAKAFNGALDRLEAAFRDLEGLTSQASHELRNGLALVQAHLEAGLAAPADLEAEARAALGATERLARWAEDVLSLSGRTTPDAPGPVDLALLAAEAADEYSRPGRVLDLDVPAEGVPLACGHETWLRRAVANLLDNAFKHGPPQGPVEVRVFHRFDAVVLSVTDHGPGIPDAELHRVWEPRWRGEAARREGRGASASGWPWSARRPRPPAARCTFCPRVGRARPSTSRFLFGQPACEASGSGPAPGSRGLVFTPSLTRGE